jgi:hypothetical protein
MKSEPGDNPLNKYDHLSNSLEKIAAYLQFKHPLVKQNYLKSPQITQYIS